MSISRHEDVVRVGRVTSEDAARMLRGNGSVEFSLTIHAGGI